MPLFTAPQRKETVTKKCRRQHNVCGILVLVAGLEPARPEWTRDFKS
jgi:hypothetical protein